MSDKQKPFEQRLAEGKGATLRRHRESSGLTQAELASMVGTSQQTVDRIEKGQIRKSKLLPALAKAVGWPYEGFDPEGIEQTMESLQAEVNAHAKRHFARRPRRIFEPSDHADDLLTIYSRGLDLVLQAADEVGRGYPVESVPDAYAVVVQDSRTAPALTPGDIAVINPHIPPYEGCDALLVSDRDGVRKGILRRILQIFDDRWEVVGPNGTDAETISRDDWPLAEPVVSKFYRVR